MKEFDQELQGRLAAIGKDGLRRELRRVDSPQSTRIHLGGRRLLNFSSNDYLGLSNEPALKNAAREAVDRFGAGAGASRLISGSLAPHAELEQTLAAFKGTEAALVFATGYAAAQGAIGSLLGPDDVIIVDRLVHACLVDAARLCRAKLRVFAHNDVDDLERILRWARERSRKTEVKGQTPEVGEQRSVPAAGRLLIVTESVFSMDGDFAPLEEIIHLKERYGAWLMVDEAHATGLYGPNRRGLADELGLAARIEVQMGTLGKAIGAAGGFICGSRLLIDYLVNRARSFIFSTAPVPAAVAAATAGVRLIQSPAGAQRRDRLWALLAQLNSELGLSHSERRSAIVPLILGEEAKAVSAAAALFDRGIFVPAIRFPTVARGQARLRLTLTADHTQGDLGQLIQALKSSGLAGTAQPT